jgi:anhydro-N-acetylmuramic acid kinase
LDIVHVRFTKENDWRYSILHAYCYKYENAFRDKITKIKSFDIFGIAALHHEIAIVTSHYVNDFLVKNNISKEDILLIASHGQTVLHQPHEGYTLQLGCGGTIAALTGIDVVSDFRTKDIAYGGQGAPMVPVGEKFLFPEFSAFLNIGGICNISIHDKDKVVGYDCAPANTLLNYFSRKVGKEYDPHGEISRTGKVDTGCLENLNNIPYYSLSIPKTMGTEYIEAFYFRELDNLNIPDALATAVEHIAYQIATCINREHTDAVYATGGGARNTFLIERIRSYLPNKKLVIPDEQIIDYKEALIIGFSGLLRYLKQPNFLSSVTGARQDSVGGALYLWS